MSSSVRSFKVRRGRFVGLFACVVVVVLGAWSGTAAAAVTGADLPGVEAAVSEATASLASARERVVSVKERLGAAEAARADAQALVARRTAELREAADRDTRKAADRALRLAEKQALLSTGAAARLARELAAAEGAAADRKVALTRARKELKIALRASKAEAVTEAAASATPPPRRGTAPKSAATARTSVAEPGREMLVAQAPAPTPAPKAVPPAPKPVASSDDRVRVAPPFEGENDHVKGMAENGAHGLVNFVTGWYEFPMQIYKGYQHGSAKFKSPAASRSFGALLGVPRGLTHAAGRTAWGVIQFGGFWARNPTTNKHVMSLLDAEYAWQKGTRKSLNNPNLDNGLNRVGIRFERGLFNVVGAVAEFPGQIRKTDGQRIVYVGPFKGLWMTASRLVYGAGELGLFLLPSPEPNLNVPFEEIQPWDALQGRYYNNWRVVD